MANRNFASGGRLFSMHVRPVMLDLNFVVDNTQPMGVRLLKGPGIQSVQMNTVGAPPAGFTNPAVGSIIIKLADNYTRFLDINTADSAPLSGTPSTSSTLGAAQVITALGTATLAQWQAAGVPPGVTPAVGLAFIGKVTGVIGGSATVDSPTSSGIDHIEVVGDPTVSLANASQPTNGGGYIILRTLLNTVATAPANSSKISCMILMSDSSVTVQGG